MVNLFFVANALARLRLEFIIIFVIFKLMFQTFKQTLKVNLSTIKKYETFFHTFHSRQWLLFHDHEDISWEFK